LDVDNGQILYGKNYMEPRPMASTTKIMTAVVALAGADVKGTVTVSPRAAAVGESSMYLEPGEKLTLEQLLYGALLNSGNDACVAIADAAVGYNPANLRELRYETVWVALTWDEKAFGLLTGPLKWKGERAVVVKRVRPWTDAYSSVLPVLKLSAFRLSPARAAR
jgi:hypothetical protein